VADDAARVTGSTLSRVGHQMSYRPAARMNSPPLPPTWPGGNAHAERELFLANRLCLGSQGVTVSLAPSKRKQNPKGSTPIPPMGALRLLRTITPTVATIGISICMHLEKQFTVLISARAKTSENPEIGNLPQSGVANFSREYDGGRFVAYVIYW
jgi:hypothetical protein